MASFKFEYDISRINPLMENNKYVIYQLGNISEHITKGIRVDKETKEQVEVQIDLLPKPHVIAIIRDGYIQKIM